MEELVTQLSSLGAIGILCALLFKNTMQEKKEDRDMYKKTVENFIELSTQQQEINKNLLMEMGVMKTDVEEIKEDVTDIKVMLQKEGDK
ncbi:putative holin [Clostridioides phage phiSemix9P1]|uniref:hypothetical protein n=1 Tax=unclassified Clostridioides TaxID=2635829 RepID=UPI00038D2635|nr:putative holin [Clostridioides phage phiSemix9P1]EQF28870.1 putative holin [Clostridioides difficile CD160]MCC0646130.1 hypothetical protein [Clostridioides sp. ZZV14-6150]MCC0704882.1 hypothetical protein [Clostridioides sp. ES-S-0049-02]MCC0724018.1 hypothetical protein [Clostridioides sp. ZZV14-6104]MCC0724847.1 hypothetical protein [Clostridioides sp. ZZV14-6045]MCC0732293.1 hypothetical protein [Clostridioides sp. ZZV14-6048]MCC0736430.1 hypothetical protein [Clostridioides sp. ZZV14